MNRIEINSCRSRTSKNPTDRTISPIKYNESNNKDSMFNSFWNYIEELYHGTSPIYNDEGKNTFNFDKALENENVDEENMDPSIEDSGAATVQDSSSLFAVVELNISKKEKRNSVEPSSCKRILPYTVLQCQCPDRKEGVSFEQKDKIDQAFDYTIGLDANSEEAYQENIQGCLSIESVTKRRHPESSEISHELYICTKRYKSIRSYTISKRENFVSNVSKTWKSLLKEERDLWTDKNRIEGEYMTLFGECFVCGTKANCAHILKLKTIYCENGGDLEAAMEELDKSTDRSKLHQMKFNERIKKYKREDGKSKIVLITESPVKRETFSIPRHQILSMSQTWEPNFTLEKFKSTKSTDERIAEDVIEYLLFRLTHFIESPSEEITVSKYS